MAANASVAEPHRLTPRGQATRERIVATASQLIYDHGVAGTSLGDVYKSAGVGPSQMYHYFQDRQSLIRAVIAHRVHAVLATLGGLDSMERLRAWRDVVVDTYRQQNCEGGCPLGSLVGELAEPFPECRADLAGGFVADLVVGLGAWAATEALSGNLSERDAERIRPYLIAESMWGDLASEMVLRGTHPFRCEICCVRAAMRRMSSLATVWLAELFCGTTL
ncbi:MAG TPA: TetR/AcrR family transcriptional regulator [Mycobacterium sp.]|nr:TetR/AcrR family transcriptional regulator [Mycobacterium sp.]